MYLFCQTNREYLKKAYPSQIQLCLLTLAFPLTENVDYQLVKEYEQELIARTSEQAWKTNKKIIVVEEFIRHKLLSAKKEDFQEYLV